MQIEEQNEINIGILHEEEKVKNSQSEELKLTQLNGSIVEE